MRVCHFTELDGVIEGGIRTSIRHQRKALDRAGVPYTTELSDDFDILHLNVLGPRSLYLLWRYSRRDVPVIMHGHEIGETFRGGFPFSRLALPAIERIILSAYNRADRVIAPTAYARKVLRDLGVSTVIDVVSNGIDAAELDEEAGRSRTDEFTVVNLSGVLPRKGVSTFIDVGRRVPDTPFKWYGYQFRFATPLRLRWKMRNAPGNVSFPGFVERKRDAFATGDVFFFPTHAESQGLSLLEAAFCGMPIIVRDIPVYEGWEHEVHCLKGDSVDEFTEHIERLREEPGLGEELGENAAELAREHTLEHVGERLEEVYTAVLGEA